MTLYRAQMVDALVALLIAARTPAGQNVTADDDWPTTSENMPAIVVYDYIERKEGLSKGSEPQFRTTLTLVVKARVVEDDKDAARRSRDVMAELIENTVLGDPGFMSLFQWVAAVNTKNELSAKGGRHFGDATIGFDCVFEERFQPVISDPLLGVDMKATQPDGVTVQIAARLELALAVEAAIAGQGRVTADATIIHGGG